MNLLEAVARWHVCEWGKDHCLGEDKCVNFIWVDPRTISKRGVGPGTTDQRTLCSLLDDLSDQVQEKT